MQLRSVEAISDYMTRHIHYADGKQRILSQDTGCWWKKPEETFRDKFGFCYDLAAFALYCIGQSCTHSGALLFVKWGDWGRTSNSGHFVCTFQREGDYYSIDNGVLKGPYRSFADLFQCAARNRRVLAYRFYTLEQVPFHTKYIDMVDFA